MAIAVASFGAGSARKPILLICLVFDDGRVRCTGLDPGYEEAVFDVGTAGVVVDCYLENWNGDRLPVPLTIQPGPVPAESELHLATMLDGPRYLFAQWANPPKRCRLHDECLEHPEMARACFLDRIGDR